MDTPIRRRITPTGLIAVVVILGLMLIVLLPAIQTARAHARDNQCAARLKHLGEALLSHHEFLKRFPPLTHQGFDYGSANVWATSAGQTYITDRTAPNGYTESPAKAAGYSWIVMLLPYLDEQELSNDIRNRSSDYQIEAFSPSVARGRATRVLDALICPQFGGAPISTASSGTARPTVQISAYAQLFDASTGSPVGVAITNYLALSATHLACMATDPDPSSAVNQNRVERPNGVLVPGRGVSLKEITDGTSKTIVVCETKEPAVNSWYDGTVAWCVGIAPHGPQPSRQGAIGTWVADGASTALNVGPSANSTALYAPEGTTVAQTQSVSWGPSSDHPGGTVHHLAADGSVHAIMDELDATLYLQLITRGGREPMSMSTCY